MLKTMVAKRAREWPLTSLLTISVKHNLLLLATREEERKAKHEKERNATKLSHQSMCTVYLFPLCDSMCVSVCGWKRRAYVLGSLTLTVMGTISALNFPSLIALAALACEATASSSCCCLVIFHCVATFSEVIPMGSRQSLAAGS